MKVKCTLSYDGSRFSGFQIQEKGRTVQGEIEKVLRKIHKGESIRIYPSGRTDAGVHALGQVIHFATTFSLKEADWKRALNAMLPDDIYIKAVEHASDAFHARYDVMEKEYQYIVQNVVEPDVFKRQYVHHFPYALNVAAIQKACSYFVGEHDFTTFSSAKSTAKGSKVRTLYEVSCKQEGNQIIFTFRGSGFLFNMVRIIVGTLLEIGQGKRRAEDIPTLFEMKDRRKAGKTAPPQGLYLWEVVYDDR